MDPLQNTDRELWREPDTTGNGDFYSDSIHVTASGGIGINCAGHVVVMPLRKWHALALASPVPTPSADARAKLEDAREGCERNAFRCDNCGFAAEVIAALLAIPPHEGETPQEPPVYGSEVLCEKCATVFCPHGERLHFHHDGCPCCDANEPAEGETPQPAAEPSGWRDIEKRLLEAIQRVIRETRGFNERKQEAWCCLCRPKDEHRLHDPECAIYALHSAYDEWAPRIMALPPVVQTRPGPIRDDGPAYPQVVDQSPTLPRVARETVASALGAVVQTRPEETP